MLASRSASEEFVNSHDGFVLAYLKSLYKGVKSISSAGCKKLFKLFTEFNNMFAVKNVSESQLGSRWVVLVTYLLRDGRPRRYAQIQREIRGISPHGLTQILHQLEMEGMIVHNVYSTMPPKVEYGLTIKGKQLLERFLDMGEKAMQNEPA